MIGRVIALSIMGNHIEIPSLQTLHSWLSPDIVRIGVFQDWIEPLIMHSLIEHFLSIESHKSVETDEKNLSNSKENESLSKFMYNQNIRNSTHLNQWLSLRRIDNHQFSSFLSRSDRWTRWVKANLSKEAHSLYLSSSDNYTTYIFSIIRVDSHSLATELKLKIDENEANFHDLARKYSLGQESASGGILGPIMGTAISPTILAHLKNLKPNQVDTIFMFEKKWNILRLDLINDPDTNPKLNKLILSDYSKRWLLDNARKLIATYLKSNDCD